MRLVAESFGFDKVHELAEAKVFSFDRETSTAESSVIVRVLKSDLELAYINDGLIFNGVNKIVQIIKNAGYHWEGPASSVRWFEDFTGSIGEMGTYSTFEDLLSLSFQHQAIYGDYWLELIRNKAHNKVVDLDFIDPKTMDYKTLTNYQPELNERTGRPVAYVQKNPMDPKKIERTITDIDFIAHFGLYTVGAGWYPLGLVEPVYIASYRRLNLEDAHSNSAYQTAFTRYVGSVGDLNHEPSPNAINQFLALIKGLKAGEHVVKPYYWALEPLASKEMESADKVLEYYKKLLTAGMGIPLAFATGYGGDVNRATLADLKRIFEYSLRDVAVRTTRHWNQLVFNQVARVHKIEPARMVWNDIETEDKTERATRFQKYAKYKMLPQEIIQKEIMKLEGFGD